MVGKVAGAQQPALLAGVPDEQQRPLRPRACRRTACASAISATVPTHRRLRRSRCDRRLAGRDASRRAGPPAAVVADLGFGIADMIVVRAERDIRVLEHRIAAFDDGDDVLRELRADDRVVDVDVEGERARRRAGTTAAARGPSALRLQLLVLSRRAAEQELEDARSDTVTAGGTGRSSRCAVVKSDGRPVGAPPAGRCRCAGGALRADRAAACS